LSKHDKKREERRIRWFYDKKQQEWERSVRRVADKRIDLLPTGEDGLPIKETEGDDDVAKELEVKFSDAAIKASFEKDVNLDGFYDAEKEAEEAAKLNVT
jgi:hypothetical protein